MRSRAGRARFQRCPATSPRGCTAPRGRPRRRRAARAARGPPCSEASADAREELLAAEHPLELALPLLVAELGDARVRRVTRNLLDPEMAVGERRGLRQGGGCGSPPPVCRGAWSPARLRLWPA